MEAPHQAPSKSGRVTDHWVTGNFSVRPRAPAGYDASRLNQAPRLLAKTSHGLADWTAQDLPEWFERLCTKLSDGASGP